MIRLQGQFELVLFQGGWLVQPAAQTLGTLALAAGFAIQCGAGQFDPGEMFEHGTGLFDGHLAGQQRGHVLHGGGITGGCFQAQGDVGGHPPLAAAFTVTPGALDGDRPIARPERAGVARRKPAQFLTAHRAHGRRNVGFGLRAPLGRLAEQFLNIVSGLDFQMAEVLVTG